MIKANLTKKQIDLLKEYFSRKVEAARHTGIYHIGFVKPVAI